MLPVHTCSIKGKGGQLSFYQPSFKFAFLWIRVKSNNKSKKIKSSPVCDWVLSAMAAAVHRHTDRRQFLPFSGNRQRSQSCLMSSPSTSTWGGTSQSCTQTESPPAPPARPLEFSSVAAFTPSLAPLPLTHSCRVGEAQVKLILHLLRVFSEWNSVWWPSLHG